MPVRLKWKLHLSSLFPFLMYRLSLLVLYKYEYSLCEVCCCLRRPDLRNLESLQRSLHTSTADSIDGTENRIDQYRPLSVGIVGQQNFR
ncbi:hypothetical protein U1Q18_050938, partial [Sarracenia purpurea var. burkii]